MGQMALEFGRGLTHLFDLEPKSGTELPSSMDRTQLSRGLLLGLLALGSNSGVVLPAGLILFREFTVSALREVGAGKGVKLPVTLLAKWKTTLQLVAIGAEMILASWGAFGLPPDPGVVGGFTVLAQFLLWAATGVTLITGAQYWEAARKALT